jgi:PPM family protein phosphatase
VGQSTATHTIELPGEPARTLTLSWAAATDTGRRRSMNEDSMISEPPVFAVADGMGGHASGDLASAAVVLRLREAIDGDFLSEDAVIRALENATWDIEDVSAGSEIGVGTTVTGAVLTMIDDEPHFTVFNIGDSRVYRLEGNDLRQVTVDHSVVQELVDSGVLSRAEAESHPDSNVITRAVGFRAAPRPDYWHIPLHAGLRLLACSDGLTKEVSDARIRLHLAAGLSVEETASALVDAALAAGGRDNVTCVLVDVVSLSPQKSDT